MGHEADTFAARDGRPRTVVEVTFRCSACGGPSSFDGVGGEWCPHCETAEYLVRTEALYQLVEIALD
jgi:Zn finger protein HypA/HybF involved in hydrogenase expression